MMASPLFAPGDLVSRVCGLLIAALCAAGLCGCGESRAPAMASAAGPAPISEANLTADAALPRPTAVSDQPGSQAADAAPASESDRSMAKAAAPARSGPPARLADISFDDIKFEMLKTEPFRREMLTDKINELDGRAVRIRGYILPSFQQTGLAQFVLVRDNLSCCFGPGAALYDCIVVDMQPDKSTDFSISPVTVEGTFSVRELLDADGKALAIYHLDGESVR